MILGIGEPFEILLAIVIYMVVTVAVTESLRKFCEVHGGKALLLSWLVGILIYVLLALAKLYVFNLQSIVLFMFVMGILNTTYKWTKLKDFIRKMFKSDI